MKYSGKRFFFKRPIRLIVQLFSAACFIVIVGFVWGAAGVHNICPWTIVEVPILMLKLKLGVFYIAGIAIGIAGIVATFFYPRPFCGWLCPLGTLFDFLGDIGQKIGFSSKTIPHWLNERMRIFSYGVFALLVVLTFLKGTLVCTSACPAFWICTAGQIAMPVLTIIFLILILALSLRVKRGFCRYVCPYGALTAVFVPLSHYEVRGNLEVCNSCRICTNACPMGIDFLHDFEAKSAHCISCGECIASCPQKALFWGKRKSLK